MLEVARRKRVSDLSCACFVSSVSSTNASVDNRCGISWATTAISPQRMTGICPCQGLMYQVKKRTGWPLSVNGVATHAYSPVEGMVSRWVGDANCLNRRCHLICCWLLLVATRPLSDFWCSNDLRALRSVGCLAPPSRCLRDLFSLVLSLGTVTLPWLRIW